MATCWRLTSQRILIYHALRIPNLVRSIPAAPLLDLRVDGSRENDCKPALLSHTGHRIDQLRNRNPVVQSQTGRQQLFQSAASKSSSRFQNVAVWSPLAHYVVTFATFSVRLKLRNVSQAGVLLRTQLVWTSWDHWSFQQWFSVPLRGMYFAQFDIEASE